MAPQRRPAVIRTINPQQDEIVINDSHGNEIIVQVCGSAASKIQLRISGPRSFEIATKNRTPPTDCLQSVKPHPHSAGGASDVCTDATRQP